MPEKGVFMNYNIPEPKKIAENAGVTEKFFKFAIGYIDSICISRLQAPDL